MSFREEVRSWLEGNFPSSLVGVSLNFEGAPDAAITDALEVWRQRLAAQGWGAPTWPTEFGGAGLAQPEAKVIAEEMAAIGAFNHIPMNAGMGCHDGGAYALRVWH